MTQLVTQYPIGEVADAAEAVAALAAALARRVGGGRTALRYLAAGGESLLTLDVESAPTFAALRDQAAVELQRIGTASPCVTRGHDAPAQLTIVATAPGTSIVDAVADDELTAVIGGNDLVLVHADGAAWPAGEVDLLRNLVCRILSAARRDDRIAISSLDLADGTEVSGFWGDPVAPVPARRLEDLIAEQAARNPGAIAVIEGDNTVTYAELNQRADELAALLAEQTEPDDIIGILMRRSLQQIVAILAIIKAGCAYLALSEDDPAPRVELLARNANVGVIVVDPDLADRAPEATIAIESIAAVGRRPGRPAAERGAAGPDGLAYVSYTSGSTGEPKGVCVPHRGVSRLVREPNWIDIRNDDVFLHVSPLSFDAATMEVFGALVNGRPLVLMPHGKAEMAEIAETVRRHQVTVLMLTTGLLHQMIVAQLPAFKGVRHVLTGGEAASAELVARLFEEHPHLLYTNGYGPTENTTYTTCWTSGPVPIGAAVPIGDPISGTSVAILDDELRPVPPGASGQLYTSGEGLARDYVGRPGATAERFLPHPSPRTPGERMYRTGDLVRRRADGAIDFIGRTDHQVKIQGFRVEPGEVEQALIRCPEVAIAAVVAQPAEAGGKRLIAYVVAQPSADTTNLSTRLRERLRDELPPHMVPWAIVTCPELKLNRHGKVDRSALPAVSRQPRNIRTEYAAPVTPTQRRVAEVWSRVLGIEPIGVHDDFFDLGGHSLLAAEVLETFSRELGVDVPARTLYLQPTVGALAAAIERR